MRLNSRAEVTGLEMSLPHIHPKRSRAVKFEGIFLVYDGAASAGLKGVLHQIQQNPDMEEWYQRKWLGLNDQDPEHEASTLPVDGGEGCRYMGRLHCSQRTGLIRPVFNIFTPGAEEVFISMWTTPCDRTPPKRLTLQWE